jgi:hypothetical protein
MPRKAARPDTQVERLADEFRRRWVAADGIEPWLRRNIGRLARLTENGWSWADIGRALTAAGITYSTGRPWTGPLLARKAVQVRAQIRKRQARRRTVDPVMPRQPRPEPVRPLAPVKTGPRGDAMIGPAVPCRDIQATARAEPPRLRRATQLPSSPRPSARAGRTPTRHLATAARRADRL